MRLQRQLTRVLSLVRTLQQTRPRPAYTLNQLARQQRVCRRTVLRDLQAIEASGGLVEWERPNDQPTKRYVGLSWESTDVRLHS